MPTDTTTLCVAAPFVSWKQWTPNDPILGAHCVSRGDYEMVLALWKRLRPPVCGEPPATEAMAQPASQKP